jgi:predicted 3-demethylubiquinone-9 3-methyltransferase (glyoxalase superfamily)
MGFDLELTGFSLDEISELEFDDDSDQKESQLKDNDYSEAFSIVIDCKSESEQEQLFKRFVSEGLVCRVQSL